jgi:hypothetical protein
MEELLLVRSKQNQGGGSSGTPIEENKKLWSRILEGQGK